MKETYDLITIGAGASGMIASIRAAERGKHVLLLEKNDHPGKKILASGNGRCNLLNTGSPRYYGNEEFAYDVLKHCPKDKIESYFHHMGLATYEETEGRIYPYSNQSATVLNVLKTGIKLFGVETKMNTPVSSVQHDGKGFSVITKSGDQYLSTNLIVACGGEAQPKLGGTRDGYQILQSMGHSVVPTYPALVSLETDKKSISGLSGIRVRCRVSLYENSNILHREEGEVLFTDYGISGICIMQCARFIHKKTCRIELDFLNRYSKNICEINEDMHRRRKLFSNMAPTLLLEGILGSRLSYAVMKQAGVPLKGETASDLSPDDLNNIIYTATHYRIEITGTRGFDYAQVTAGGAECSEFNPLTMKSKIVPGLFATGEVLNVDGDCGGFNLMFAFASGLTAGEQI